MSKLALAPFFAEGVAVTVSSVILFIGSVYLLLAAIFGLRMGYLVLAVSFFGWMIILSALWVFGAPGTPPHLGPRGTEPHWEVFAAGTGTVQSGQYPQTAKWPGRPWHAPDRVSQPSVDSVRAVIQEYMAVRAAEQLAQQGAAAEGEAPEAVAAEGQAPEGVAAEGQAAEEAPVNETQFSVEDIRFAKTGDTHLAAGNAFFTLGGPEVTVFAYHNKGNIPIYSYSFLAASLLGFALHLPFLDRAEKKRKAVLTGGTPPPWYGPA